MPRCASSASSTAASSTQAAAALLNERQYKTLLADLRRIIGEGKQEAERAAAQALLESYWSIGKRIAKEKLTTRAGFHNAILTDLSATRLRTAIQGARYEAVQRQKPGKPLILPRPRDPSYLYKAEVRDVIDADTLLLDIDLGFEVIRRYVAHVFYAFNKRGIEHTFLKGRYLNQELVDKRFAKMV